MIIPRGVLVHGRPHGRQALALCSLTVLLVCVDPGWGGRTARGTTAVAAGERDATRARPPAPASRPARKGLVRLEGRAFIDDDGPYLAVGTSLFWALWGFQHDRDRLKKHLDYLSNHGIDYIRVFGVIGPRWADRVVDPRDRAWDERLAGLLDLAHGTYGLIEGNQLVRAFAATSNDGRIVAMPIGASVPVPFTPHVPVHIDVHDPMTGNRLESHDGPFTLSPRPAAVLMGRRR